jgi:hypothetical protein
MVPGIERNIEYVIIIVVTLSVLPLIYKYVQHKRR